MKDIIIFDSERVSFNVHLTGSRVLPLRVVERRDLALSRAQLEFLMRYFRTGNRPYFFPSAN